MWSSDTSQQDIRELASDHEQADTRIVLHAQDAAARGYKQVNILCRDTEVLVLLLAHREQLCQGIWMFAGTSRQRPYIPVHRIPLSEETSQFCVGGKASALHLTTWNTLEKKAKSVLMFLPKLKPLYTNSMIREHIRGENQQRKSSSVLQIQQRS